MSNEKFYSGHTAEEVIELMGMLAAQHDVHSADEWIAIVRRGSALLKDQALKLEARESRLGEVQKYWDDEKRRYDAADKAFCQVCDERDALQTRLDAISVLCNEADKDNSQWVQDDIRKILDGVVERGATIVEDKHEHDWIEITTIQDAADSGGDMHKYVCRCGDMRVTGVVKLSPEAVAIISPES